MPRRKKARVIPSGADPSWLLITCSLSLPLNYRRLVGALPPNWRECDSRFAPTSFRHRAFRIHALPLPHLLYAAQDLDVRYIHCLVAQFVSMELKWVQRSNQISDRKSQQLSSKTLEQRQKKLCDQRQWAIRVVGIGLHTTSPLNVIRGPFVKNI